LTHGPERAALTARSNEPKSLRYSIDEWMHAATMIAGLGLGLGFPLVTER